MKNSPWLCPGCNRLHDNPLIEQFNAFLKVVCPKPPPPDAEMDLYRCYMAGMSDMLKLLSIVSDFPEELSTRLVNQVAINVRDGVLAGITDPGLKEQIHAELTRVLAIRENSCAHN